MSKKSNLFKNAKKRIQRYLKRRPHRSFRFTRRRDYARSLKLPKYWAFTTCVQKTLWKNKKIFILLAMFYAVLTVLLAGIASQDTYTALSDTLKSTGGDAFSGIFGSISGAGLLLASMMTGGLSTNLTDVQQIYAILTFLLTWLTTVWVLRNLLAGNKIRLRDGIYSSGSPIVPTFLIMLVLLVQMLPFAIAMIGYGSASTTGLLSGGVEAMLFWIAAGLLTITSLYLITGTIFALVIVTLPGMYPMRAIKISGDMVIGRRIRILLRLVWMLLIEVIVWLIVMVPIILFINWLATIWTVLGNIPIIPGLLLIMSSFTVVWTSSYIYLLYRKVVEDEAEPA